MFVLALELGKTVSEISNMSSLELSEWIAYDRISPLGRESRADLRSAITSMVVANANTSGSKRFEISDFMPYEKKPVKKSTHNAISDFKAQIKLAHERAARGG